MLLATDVGNTNITLGVYDDERLLFTARLATDRRRTGDQYAIEIRDVIMLNGCDPSLIEDAIISSVVPQAGSAVAEAIGKLCGIVPLVLGPGIKTGLNIKIDDPAQLGADLAAGAVGALAEYNMPCIIIDLGTATTVSVLDAEGRFLGGAIAAGVNLTLKALCENTAILPAVDISAPRSVIGRNTADSMRSGLVFGAASMIDGMVERISDELHANPTVVATGGLAREIIGFCKTDIIYNENLLLDGLYQIYERNK